jgi:cytochrome c-type biogenesis protein CcmH
MQRLYLIIISFSFFMIVPTVSNLAYAGIEVRSFEKSEQKALYEQLIYELRCLVCQNENLAASNAELAKDLRDEVYKMITKKGMQETEIKDFLIQRYGDFVLYKPPVKGSTALLWAGPFILLLLGFIILFFVLRHTRKQASSTLDSTQRNKMKKLLDADNHQDKDVK